MKLVLSTAAKKVQTELFANITAEGIRIDSEKEFSLSYIDSYLKIESRIPVEYDFLEINKQHLSTHLKIIEPVIKTVGTCLQQELELDSQIQEITNFIPSMFEINSITTYAQTVKLTEVKKTMESTKKKTPGFITDSMNLYSTKSYTIRVLYVVVLYKNKLLENQIRLFLKRYYYFLIRK